MTDYPVGTELENWIRQSRLTVIVGHFGTGKTEVSVNMAMAMGGLCLPFIFADLDVVDPYFRSRECADIIRQAGGTLITSSQECMDADVPSIPSDTAALFDDRSKYGIMDIGGDPSGARVMAQFAPRIAREQARVVCVINAARPLTRTPREAVSYIRSIEKTGRLQITGLINNTHLCGETTPEDVLEGAGTAREVSEISGIPLICHTVEAGLFDANRKMLLPELTSHGDTFIWPVRIYMRKPWEL